MEQRSHGNHGAEIFYQQLITKGLMYQVPVEDSNITNMSGGYPEVDNLTKLLFDSIQLKQAKHKSHA